MFGTGVGVLMLYDADEGKLITSASVGLTPEQLEDPDPAPIGSPPADGLTAIISGGVIVQNMESDPVFAPHAAAALRAGYRSVCSTPLLTCEGNLVGAIAAYFREPHPPDDRETRLIELYARQAADFIDKARLYREIQESDRRKGEFLAMLGHELRNPLAPILNALHLIGLPGADRDEVEHVRIVAERQVRHLARLVDDLLDVWRIDSGKIELRKDRVDLRDAVFARPSSRPGPSSRSAATTSSSRSPICRCRLEADAARLEQIFANLLNNAAKYTEPGGRISLEARCEDSESSVVIRDNGIGIDPALLPRVFDLFTQADRALDRSQGGLGIGLTLVRRLVELHGGTVSARPKAWAWAASSSSACPSPGRYRAALTTRRAMPTGPRTGNPSSTETDPRSSTTTPTVRGCLARLLRASGHAVDVALRWPLRPRVHPLAHARHRPARYRTPRHGWLRGRPPAPATRRPRSDPPVALTGYGQAEDRAAPSRSASTTTSSSPSAPTTSRPPDPLPGHRAELGPGPVKRRCVGLTGANFAARSAPSAWLCGLRVGGDVTLVDAAQDSRHDVGQRRHLPSLPGLRGR